MIFDQRGAGRSRPLGEIADNTTDLLIEDIEALRRQLDIDRWHVFGGSWGSTLALAYGEVHPERLCCCAASSRCSEIDWFFTK